MYISNERFQVLTYDHTRCNNVVVVHIVSEWKVGGVGRPDWITEVEHIVDVDRIGCVGPGREDIHHTGNIHSSLIALYTRLLKNIQGTWNHIETDEVAMHIPPTFNCVTFLTLTVVVWTIRRCLSCYCSVNVSKAPKAMMDIKSCQTSTFN